MSLTLSATAIAFILAFSYVGGWAEVSVSVLMEMLYLFETLLSPFLSDDMFQGASQDKKSM